MQLTQIEDPGTSDSSVNAVDLDVLELEDQELASVAGGPWIVNY